MKVGILSQSDYGGGAFIAANRLHRGLLQAGLDSTMVVGKKITDDPTIISTNSRMKKLFYQAAMALEFLPLKYYPKRKNSLFSVQWVPELNYSQINALDVDIYNLHWINLNFINIENIARLNKPIIWTIHDMWFFTGGCHTTQGCINYQKACGTCPQLQSKNERDLSSWVLKRKTKAWKNLGINVVAPSEWLADCARSSPLLLNSKVRVIHHGLDLEKYKPIEKKIARNILNLPLDKQIITFGAGGTNINDLNKGFHFLYSALQELNHSDWQDKIELTIFGSSNKTIDLDFKTHYLGKVYDDISLAIIYSAADVVVVPSKQESFGLVACESLACGTPVVAFNATGLKDIVDHQQTGYLAQPYETEDLAQGIAWVLSDAQRHHQLRTNAREKAQREFNLQLQANRYQNLFAEVLEHSN